MPIQPTGARGVRGSIEIYGEFVRGLKDIDGFSRIIHIYSFHRSSSFELETTPFLDPTPRGVFATRAPRRPNALGLSCVRLVERDGAVLTIEDVDILDGTPLLDIKPYVPEFDSYRGAACGWLQTVAGNAKSTRSDDRFCENR
jgi:tRNA-Thr(GGU) m(6)t(6)A37 methyltransferase TsaA